MNEWAKHYGDGIERRIYRREFAALLGYGATWFRHLEKQGVIPQGNTDPGGKRKWWRASIVRVTLDQLNADAERTA